jgi:general secretion pathway protein G
MVERIRKSKDEGFTLIELLIVVIILGILAAIVVFAVGSTRHDSVSATCKTDVKSIQLAEEALNTKTGAYTIDYGQNTSPLLSGQGGVLKSWPTNPNITFTLASDPTGYKITVAGNGVGGSVLANGTDDDVKAACGG